MSMTIKGILAELQSAVLMAVTIVLGWFAVMLVSMAVFEPTDTALVIVRDHSILERLPDHIRFTAMGEKTLTLRSTKPGFVSDVYSLGGLLVFPALANGCISLRS